MRLEELKDLAAEQVSDVEELVRLLELSIEDILQRFPDILTEQQHKFGVEQQGDC